jgi:hypothetical protein
MTNPYPPVHRPGISENILISAGICYCDYPEPESIKIPYWTRDGDITQWCRYRLKSVRDNGQKYYQEPNSGVNIYFPPNFSDRVQTANPDLGPTMSF